MIFLAQSNISQSFQSPYVRVLLGAIAIALLYVFYKEVRKIPAKLFTLMITAFVDMVGLLMIIPLMPFYVKTLGGSGIKRARLSCRDRNDFRHHRRRIHRRTTFERADVGTLFRSRRTPATLLIALGAAGISYLVFGFATSLWVLFLSRIVQGPAAERSE